MRFVRSVPRRTLLTALLGVVAAFAAITAAAALALGGNGSPPPAKPLAQAIRDAIAAPAPTGVSARITFTNHLFDSLSTGEGSQPLLKGGSGRLWATADNLRLELQGDSGDVQIVVSGNHGFVYDGGTSNTAYRFTLPAQGRPHDEARQDALPTLAQIRSKLDKAAQRFGLGAAEPTTVAGRGAYSVRVTPKQSGGLIGAAELAWDAARGVPLRFAVYARGSSTPALELEATDVSFGSVPSSTFEVQPPAGAHVVDLTGSPAGAKAPEAGKDRTAASLPSWLDDPATLAGKSRSDAKPLGHGGALVVYGKGPGAIVVLERQVDAKKQQTAPSPRGGGDPGTELTLPTISIGGSKAIELSTPLGALVTFERGGISYTVFGSEPASVIEAAARGL